VNTGFRRSSGPIGELVRRITELERAVRSLSHDGSFQIPVVEIDPDPSERINLWLFPDGRLRGRHWNPTGTAWVIREWVATSPGGSTSSIAPAPPADAAVSYRSSYEATWSASYTSDGTKRTDEAALLMAYGQVEPANGRGRSLAGFDHATIQSDLASSTIYGVSLTMQNRSSVWDSGSTVYVGVHDFSSEPATWAGGGIPISMGVGAFFTPQETKTFPLSIAIGGMLRDGSALGIALEVPSSDPGLAGYMSGVAPQYSAPVLTVDYAK
jgi:hypothetical protein